MVGVFHKREGHIEINGLRSHLADCVFRPDIDGNELNIFTFMSFLYLNKLWK